MNNYHNRYDKFNNPAKEDVKEFEDLQKEVDSLKEPESKDENPQPDVKEAPVENVEVVPGVEITIDKSNYVVDGTPKLNVRELASIDSKVLRVLNSGEVVIPTETQADGDWFRITSPVQGYVMKKYIKKA